jgi:uncharacterized protein YoaH (UPF0181 family)
MEKVVVEEIRENKWKEKKIMEKIVVEEIRENKWKEKEENWAKWVAELGFVTNWVTRKCVEKGARAKFIVTWTPIAIAKVGDHFHQEF